MLKNLIVIVGLTISFSVQAQFRKAPYLIYTGDNTEMTIMFQTYQSQGFTIKWGLNENYADGDESIVQTLKDEKNNIYVYTLKSLIPSKKYFYKIITKNNTKYSGSFYAAKDNKNENINFYVFGDTRTNTNVQDKLTGSMLKHMKASEGFQTFSLHTGDWVTTGNCEKTWDKEYFNQKYKNNISLYSTIPIMGTRGNHELYGCGKQKENIFLKYFPYPYIEDDKTYYSFNYGQVQIFVLDQYSDFNEDAEQYKWLIKSLTNSTYKWKFILLHAPGWSAGRHENEKAQIFVQEYIQKLAEKYRVQMIFAGHNHFYAHSEINRVHHMTLGGGGARLYKPKNRPNLIKSEKANHFLTLEIVGNHALVKAIRTDLSIIETIELKLEN